MPPKVFPAAKGAPFPQLEGGCNCIKHPVRYRLRAPPLYCYACHCADCQRETGTVFACTAKIEWDMIESIGDKHPVLVTVRRKVTAHQKKDSIYLLTQCPDCKITLWNTGDWSPATLSVHVGTLDLPGIMEPDMHIFTAAKVRWLPLPEGAQSLKGDLDERLHWPKSSLLRLKKCMERFEKLKEVRAAAAKAREEAIAAANAQKEKEAEKQAEAGDEEAEKTPTNGSPEPEVDGGEMTEEEFEEYKRGTTERERDLQERLEQLTLKLKEYEKV